MQDHEITNYFLKNAPEVIHIIRRNKKLAEKKKENFIKKLMPIFKHLYKINPNRSEAEKSIQEMYINIHNNYVLEFEKLEKRFEYLNRDIQDQEFENKLEYARNLPIVYVFEILGIKVKKNKCICPFHDEKSPSLSITPEKNLWRCFGCGEGGDSIKLIMKHENLNFHKAVNFLSNK